MWKKRILNKTGLVKFKSLKNTLPWCKEGKVQTTLSEVMCIPVGLTVLGLVQTPENTIQGLNQSTAKIELHDNSCITEGSDYKTVWCPQTVHKTIGHLGWSCRKFTSKQINNEEMCLVEEIQNNYFSGGVAK